MKKNTSSQNLDSFSVCAQIEFQKKLTLFIILTLLPCTYLEAYVMLYTKMNHGTIKKSCDLMKKEKSNIFLEIFQHFYLFFFVAIFPFIIRILN